ncbi:MFS general substrate transporter [Pyrrhoderma noxium]|uniref:MFS general substrate transporter n=1 Tax=Pyrrhoderma noxium TaxID=2282107 RepID=A0A286U6A9_9AGAM|nr:MFS general substrate transporter [Pyrrhoderma noxium]
MSVSPLTENSLHDRKVKDPEDLRCVAVAELPAKGTGVETPGIELENFELSSVPISRVTTAPLVPDAPALTDLELKKARRAEIIGFGALLWAMFMEGWNDGTNGPMLPKIESYYNLNLAVVSLIFVMNVVGFVSGALANVPLSVRVGFGKTLVIGAIIQLIAYVIQSTAPPYPLFAIAYIFSGFGMAVQNSQAMVFTVSLRNSSTKMGIIHACYGLGALSAPLVATQFAYMPRWSFFYLVSMGGALINIIYLSLAFRFQKLDACLLKAGQVVREQGSTSQNNNLYSQIMKLKVVHLLAFFALAYIGVEVTIGGWIVKYIMAERNGGSTSGYISSGFFAGLALGRVGLLWFNKLVGERRVIWLYILLCIGLEIIIWIVPSLVGDAVAVSFIGLFLGPVYPIVMNRTALLVPPWLMSSAVGWIAALGMSGSAVLPFITGVMSNKLGLISLQPLVVSALAVMFGLWMSIPAAVHRSD